MKTRAAVILKFQDKILLIERRKVLDGKELNYFCLPGGTKEENETIEKTAVREIFEELSYEIKKEEDLKFLFNIKINIEDIKQIEESFYFLYEVGDEFIPKTSEDAPEIKKIEEVFLPIWTSKERLHDLNILPIKAKSWLIENL